MAEQEKAMGKSEFENFLKSQYSETQVKDLMEQIELSKARVEKNLNEEVPSFYGVVSRYLKSNGADCIDSNGKINIEQINKIANKIEKRVKEIKTNEETNEKAKQEQDAIANQAVNDALDSIDVKNKIDKIDFDNLTDDDYEFLIEYAKEFKENATEEQYAKKAKEMQKKLGSTDLITALQMLDARMRRNPNYKLTPEDMNLIESVPDDLAQALNLDKEKFKFDAVRMDTLDTVQYTISKDLNEQLSQNPELSQDPEQIRKAREKVIERIKKDFDFPEVILSALVNTGNREKVNTEDKEKEQIREESEELLKAEVESGAFADDIAQALYDFDLTSEMSNEFADVNPNAGKIEEMQANVEKIIDKQMDETIDFADIKLEVAEELGVEPLETQKATPTPTAGVVGMFQEEAKKEPNNYAEMQAEEPTYQSPTLDNIQDEKKGGIRGLFAGIKNFFQRFGNNNKFNKREEQAKIGPAYEKRIDENGYVHEEYDGQGKSVDSMIPFGRRVQRSIVNALDSIMGKKDGVSAYNDQQTAENQLMKQKRDFDDRMKPDSPIYANSKPVSPIIPVGVSKDDQRENEGFGIDD